MAVHMTEGGIHTALNSLPENPRSSSNRTVGSTGTCCNLEGGDVIHSKGDRGGPVTHVQLPSIEGGCAPDGGGLQGRKLTGVGMHKWWDAGIHVC